MKRLIFTLFVIFGLSTNVFGDRFGSTSGATSFNINKGSTDGIYLLELGKNRLLMPYEESLKQKLAQDEAKEKVCKGNQECLKTKQVKINEEANKIIRNAKDFAIPRQYPNKFFVTFKADLPGLNRYCFVRHEYSPYDAWDIKLTLINKTDPEKISASLVRSNLGFIESCIIAKKGNELILEAYSEPDSKQKDNFKLKFGIKGTPLTDIKPNVATAMEEKMKNFKSKLDLKVISAKSKDGRIYTQLAGKPFDIKISKTSEAIPEAEAEELATIFSSDYKVTLWLDGTFNPNDWYQPTFSKKELKEILKAPKGTNICDLPSFKQGSILYRCKNNGEITYQLHSNIATNDMYFSLATVSFHYQTVASTNKHKKIISNHFEARPYEFRLAFDTDTFVDKDHKLTSLIGGKYYNHNDANVAKIMAFGIEQCGKNTKCAMVSYNTTYNMTTDNKNIIVWDTDNLKTDECIYTSDDAVYSLPLGGQIYANKVLDGNITFEKGLGYIHTTTLSVYSLRDGDGTKWSDLKYNPYVVANNNIGYMIYPEVGPTKIKVAFIPSKAHENDCIKDSKSNDINADGKIGCIVQNELKYHEFKLEKLVYTAKADIIDSPEALFYSSLPKVEKKAPKPGKANKKEKYKKNYNTADTLKSVKTYELTIEPYLANDYNLHHAANLQSTYVKYPKLYTGNCYAKDIKVGYSYENINSSNTNKLIYDGDDLEYYGVGKYNPTNKYQVKIPTTDDNNFTIPKESFISNSGIRKQSITKMAFSLDKIDYSEPQDPVIVPLNKIKPIFKTSDGVPVLIDINKVTDKNALFLYGRLFIPDYEFTIDTNSSKSMIQKDFESYILVYCSEKICGDHNVFNALINADIVRINDNISTSTQDIQLLSSIINTNNEFQSIFPKDWYLLQIKFDGFDTGKDLKFNSLQSSGKLTFRNQMPEALTFRSFNMFQNSNDKKKSSIKESKINYDAAIGNEEYPKTFTVKAFYDNDTAQGLRYKRLMFDKFSSGLDCKLDNKGKMKCNEPQSVYFNVTFKAKNDKWTGYGDEGDVVGVKGTNQKNSRIGSQRIDW